MLNTDRFKELENQINQKLGFALQSIPYNPTLFTLSNGTDAVVDEVFSYQIANKFKNHWSAATAMSDPQAGMIRHDTDDDTWQGYTTGAAWITFVTGSGESFHPFLLFGG